MNSRRGLVAILGLVLFGLLPTCVLAEVGALVPGPTGSTSYAMRSIIDDPEPVGIWQRFSPDTPQRVVLNDLGDVNNDGPPSIVQSSVTARPIVAWAKNSPGGYDIVVSRFDNGAWVAPVVLAGTSADELDPHLTEDPSDGSIHMVYWVNDASPRVMYRHAPADLSSWSAPVQVSTPGQIAVRPSATFHGGELQVVYEQHDSGLDTTPRQIRLASGDDVQGFTGQMLAITQHAGANWAQIHSSSSLLWAEWIDADQEMSWTRQEPGASWDPILIEPFVDSEERDFHVRGEIQHQALD